MSLTDTRSPSRKSPPPSIALELTEDRSAGPEDNTKAGNGELVLSIRRVSSPSLLTPASSSILLFAT